MKGGTTTPHNWAKHAIANDRFGSEAEIQTWGNRWERCLQGLIRIGEAGAAAPQRRHGHQQWLDQKSSARANGIQGEQP